MAHELNKWREARILLIQAALRRPAFGRLRPLLSAEDLEGDIQRLVYLLNDVSAKNPKVFSFSLQSFLGFMGVVWPPGVFKHDMALPSGGRPLSELSINSWHMHVDYGFGWRSVAADLIPEEYSRDPEAAATKVRKAAQHFKMFRRSVEYSITSSSKRIQRLLDELVWTDGLKAIARLVVLRSVWGALQGARVHLQVVNVKPVTKDSFDDDATWQCLCPGCALQFRVEEEEEEEEEEEVHSTPCDATRRRNKWVESRNLLIQHARRMPTFDRPRARLPSDDLEGDVQRLLYLLCEVSACDPKTFSISLQSFLAFMTIQWPDGVFEHDFALPSRGRPLSTLGVRTWVLTAKYGYGMRSAAKNLIADEYRKNPHKAVTKVRKAAARFEAFQTAVEEAILSPDERTHQLLDQIIWLEGLRVIIRRLIDHKIAAAMQSEPVFLEVSDSDGSDEDKEPE